MSIPIETSITAAEHIPIIIIDLSGILTLLKPYVSPTLQLSKLNVKANKIRDNKGTSVSSSLIHSSAVCI